MRVLGDLDLGAAGATATRLVASAGVRFGAAAAAMVRRFVHGKFVVVVFGPAATAADRGFAVNGARHLVPFADGARDLVDGFVDDNFAAFNYVAVGGWGWCFDRVGDAVCDMISICGQGQGGGGRLTALPFVVFFAAKEHEID